MGTCVGCILVGVRFSNGLKLDRRKRIVHEKYQTRMSFAFGVPNSFFIKCLLQLNVDSPHPELHYQHYPTSL